MSRQYTSVQTLLGVLGSRCTSQRTSELDGNGYSFTGSAEGNRLMNEWVSHHRVVPGVRRDAQTSASRSDTNVHTLWCVLESDEQRGYRDEL